MFTESRIRFYPLVFRLVPSALRFVLDPSIRCRHTNLTMIDRLLELFYLCLSPDKFDAIFFYADASFFVESTDCLFEYFFTYPKPGIDFFRRTFISNLNPAAIVFYCLRMDREISSTL